MCGILGYVSREMIDGGVFSQALSTLALRGPDAIGVRRYSLPGVDVLLGHTRLAVIDPRPAGNQPMEHQNLSLVFNGEIYNFKEIKPHLLRTGYRFTTNTDTETLLYGYAQWGSGVVERIKGMFAFAVLDTDGKTLFCARDHFGKKPLYYFFDDKRFAFASEVKALIALPEIRSSLSLDERSMAKFLVYGYVPSPGTIFTEIKKLEPASVLELDIDAWNIEGKHRFWRLEDVPVDESIDEDEALDGIEERLRESVRKRLIADVPLGVFLSGGVDSSLVTALVAQEKAEVASFTVAYRDEAQDEAEYAMSTSRRLGIEQSFVSFTDRHVREFFREIVDYLDEPLADPAVIPLYFIARNAREKMTVALSGDGGDEVFCGYPKYRAQLVAEKLKWASALAPYLRKFTGAGSIQCRFLEGMGMPFYGRQFYYGSGGFTPREALALLRMEDGSSWIFEEAEKANGHYAWSDVINRALYLDCRIQLPDWYLVKADRATMAASLELRSPLLDKDLAEYAFGLRGSLKMGGGELKHLLKKLAARYVPREVVYRRKQGFVVPLRRWIDGVLRKDFERVLAYDWGVFDMDSVRDLVERHRKGVQGGSEFMLLRLFMVNHYLDKIGWIH